MKKIWLNFSWVWAAGLGFLMAPAQDRLQQSFVPGSYIPFVVLSVPSSQKVFLNLAFAIPEAEQGAHPYDQAQIFARFVQTKLCEYKAFANLQVQILPDKLLFKLESDRDHFDDLINCLVSIWLRGMREDDAKVAVQGLQAKPVSELSAVACQNIFQEESHFNQSFDGDGAVACDGAQTAEQCQKMFALSSASFFIAGDIDFNAVDNILANYLRCFTPSFEQARLQKPLSLQPPTGAQRLPGADPLGLTWILPNSCYEYAHLLKKLLLKGQLAPLKKIAHGLGGEVELEVVSLRSGVIFTLRLSGVACCRQQEFFQQLQGLWQDLAAGEYGEQIKALALDRLTGFSKQIYYPEKMLRELEVCWWQDNDLSDFFSDYQQLLEQANATVPRLMQAELSLKYCYTFLPPTKLEPEAQAPEEPDPGSRWVQLPERFHAPASPGVVRSLVHSDDSQVCTELGQVTCYDTSVDVASMHLSARHRCAMEQSSDGQQVSLMFDVLKRDMDQSLRHQLGQQGAHVALWFGCNLSTHTDYFDAALAALASALLNPRFSQASLDISRAEMIESVRAKKKNVVANTLRQHYSQCPEFFRSSMDYHFDHLIDQLGAITLGHLEKLHRQFFSSQNLIMALGGRLPDQCNALVGFQNNLLAQPWSPGPMLIPPSCKQESPNMQLVVREYEGESCLILLPLGLSQVSSVHPDNALMFVANEVLAQRLGQAGWSGGISMPRHFGGVSAVFCKAGAADLIPRLMAYKQALRELIVFGLTPEEFGRAKRSVHQLVATSFSNMDFFLQSGVEELDKASAYRQMYFRLEKMSLELVNVAIRQHFYGALGVVMHPSLVE